MNRMQITYHNTALSTHLVRWDGGTILQIAAIESPTVRSIMADLIARTNEKTVSHTLTAFGDLNDRADVWFSLLQAGDKGFNTSRGPLVAADLPSLTIAIILIGEVLAALRTH